MIARAAVSLALVWLSMPPQAVPGPAAAADRMRTNIFQRLRDVDRDIRASRGEASSSVGEGGEVALQNAGDLPRWIVRLAGDRR